MLKVQEKVEGLHPACSSMSSMNIVVGGCVLVSGKVNGHFLNVQDNCTEVVCICTLSAFYHMAKQYNREVSGQATDEKIVISRVQYMCTHSYL